VIVNNLMVKVKPGRESDIPFAKERLLSMKGNVDVLLDVSVGMDVMHGDASYDFLLTTKFASMEDFKRYINDPYHLEVAKYIVEMKELGASVCFEV